MSSDEFILLFTIPSTAYSSTLHGFELLLCFLLFMALFSFWLTPGGLAWALSRAQNRAGPVIPGPSGLPLLGLVLAFTSSLTHRLLFNLSQTFKASSLMAFSLGFTRFVISSKAETAMEILNSPAFADRPVKESAYELMFHRAMGFAPYGEYWKFNWSDHFPFVGWMDLQGVRKRSRELVAKVNVYVGKIVEEHWLKRVESAASRHYDDHDHNDDDHDFVDVLLDLQKENRLSDSDMIAVLWEMIFRGTDTVAILLEWILARMILHPHIQTKAQQEIDTLMGPNRPVTDSDLSNLPYLQAIVKETLRMHPPGPLLSWARLAIHDTHVGPYYVPAGTTAMVNMWAIARDESVWAEPTVFRPERFMEEDVAILGSDLRLAPFGSGRRVCPGKAMGLATVHLWLAQLLQSYRWTGCSDHGVDLAECLTLSMRMKHPLICKAIPRVGLK